MEKLLGIIKKENNSTVQFLKMESFYQVLFGLKTIIVIVEQIIIMH